MNEQQKAIAEIVRECKFEFSLHDIPYDVVLLGDLVHALADFFVQEDQHRDCAAGCRFERFDRAKFIAKCYGKRKVTT